MSQAVRAIWSCRFSSNPTRDSACRAPERGSGWTRSRKAIKIMKSIRLLRLAAGLLSGGVLALAAPAVSQAEFSAPYTARCSGGEVEALVTGLQSEATSRWAFEFHSGDKSSPLTCAG